MNVESVTVNEKQGKQRMSSREIKALLICGVFAYAVATIGARMMPEPNDLKPYEDWIGAEARGVTLYYGSPAKVDPLSNGGYVMHYERLLAREDFYTVHRFSMKVSPTGIVEEVVRHE